MNAARLAALRVVLPQLRVDAVIVPRADEHLGEYVPARAERLAWLTGFTGSAGLAAVTPSRACVFSDGRYTLQLTTQTDPNLWERRHMVEEPAAQWLVSAGVKTCGYDPWLISEDGLKPYLEAGLSMVPLASNPVDDIWFDQPRRPLGEAVPHALDLAGVSSQDKRNQIAETLRKSGEAACVVTDPASIAWVFNLRGSDVPYTPFALGFALLCHDGSALLFMDGAKLPPQTRAWLGNQVELREPSRLAATLGNLAGHKVRVDPAASPVWFAQTLRAAGAEISPGADPCLIAKACKNAVEQQGSRTAHLRDAVAMCRFLHWFDNAGEGLSELSVAARLLEFRQAMEGFRMESFPAITGSGPNGAIVHYRASAESNRRIGRNEVYLIDSGGQYTCGTTDITRTLWTGPLPAAADIRARFTRVLQGHIAIARLVFPAGVCGAHIDAFARAALWRMGLDYDHGTGHGVGSFLSVHEGPVSLSRAARPVPLQPGMILSNEPGYYQTGAYGIRIENLLLVHQVTLPDAQKPFLGFETLSLAPIDQRLIEPALLTPDERGWIDAYHARVRETVSPHLDAPARKWLETACVKLG